MMNQELTTAERWAAAYPQSFVSWIHLGRSFYYSGDLGAAERCWKTALAIDPSGETVEALDEGNGLKGLNASPAHNNLALLMLHQGRFQEAQRYFQAAPAKPFHGLTEWRGERLEGKSLLVHHMNEGHGDLLHYCRYLPFVRARRLVVVVHPRLLRLFERLLVRPDSPPIYLFAQAGPPLPPPGLDCDYWSNFSTLVFAMTTSWETIPETVPYLGADPRLVFKWQESLSRTRRGMRVGIVWQGSGMKEDFRRSVELGRFRPLARLPGVQLVSLQAPGGNRQIESIDFPLIDLGSKFDRYDFSDAAAALVSLDLVISVDSAMVHLAGALGRQTWLLNRANGDTRWFLGRDDSPWYPTMKIFHQKRLDVPIDQHQIQGDWDGVFQRVHHALAAAALCLDR